MEFAILYIIIGVIAGTVYCRIGGKDDAMGDRMFTFWVIIVAWPFGVLIALFSVIAWVFIEWTWGGK